MTPKECASELARPFGVGISDDSFVVERNGQKARVTIDTSSGTVSGVIVTAYGPPLPEVTLKRETSFDRLGKSMRVAREAQLGDPEFDARVYVDTSLSDEQVRWLLASPTARARVLALLDTCRDVELTEQGIVTKVSDETIFTENHARLVSHLDHLFVLMGSLPPEASSLRAGQKSESSFAFVMACIVGGALSSTAVFAAMLIVYGEAELFSPFALGVRGVLLSLGAWIFVTIVATLFLSGRSSSFYRVTAFSFGSLAVLGPLGPTVLAILNERLDTSPVVEHRMQITRAYMEEDDEGDETLYIQFISPLEPSARITLSFGGETVPPPGTMVNVKVRRGALGFPYRTETSYGP